MNIFQDSTIAIILISIVISQAFQTRSCILKCHAMCFEIRYRDIELLRSYVSIYLLVNVFDDVLPKLQNIFAC